MKTLKDHIESSIGYSILTATMGTNGNGGLMSDADTLLEAPEYLEKFEPVEFDAEELAKHWADATTEALSEAGDLADWIAFDLHHQDAQGYMTGAADRIYINTAI